MVHAQETTHPSTHLLKPTFIHSSIHIPTHPPTYPLSDLNVLDLGVPRVDLLEGGPVEEGGYKPSFLGPHFDGVLGREAVGVGESLVLYEGG